MTKSYPNDLTWEQWELIANLFPEAKSGGRPLPRGDASRTDYSNVCCDERHYLRTDALRFTWRALPGDFPARSTVLDNNNRNYRATQRFSRYTLTRYGEWKSVRFYIAER